MTKGIQDGGAQPLRLFLLITKHRMLDHYLPKLMDCLSAVNQDTLWRKNSGQTNTIGGITLHVIEHVSRSIQKLSNPGAPGKGGFEDYFPQQQVEPAALAVLVRDTFREWGVIMDRLLEPTGEAVSSSPPDMHHLYHLVEHFSYHLGQVIDRVQRYSGRSFQFVQNGINEKALRARVDSSIQTKL